MFPQISIQGNTGIYKDRILNFISGFSDAVFLDSNENGAAGIPFTGVKYSYLAAAGISKVIQADHNSLDQLQSFIEHAKTNGEWLFGFLSYDLKNELENLVSGNPDHNGFPLFHFFSARHVFVATEDELTIIDEVNPAQLWNEVLTIENEKASSDLTTAPPAEIKITHILNRDKYLASVKNLLEHIQRGDIYEINFCHEIIAETVNLDPVSVFRRMRNISPNPFSCYYQTRGLHLICSSPERFVARRGNRLISQPIKGTAARSADTTTDSLNRSRLESSEKERSENIMIVDLVRNDLSKVAEKGTVKVEELCGIYTFPKVHQMISTVSCILPAGTGFIEVVKALFPMGSMTGAPKISAMKLIDQEEEFKRSLYSGTVGYISPDGDFDFNVVIRSILFCESTGVATLAAGSAITAASNPDQEYLETLVKLAPQLEALGASAEAVLKEVSDGAII